MQIHQHTRFPTSVLVKRGPENWDAREDIFGRLVTHVYVLCDRDFATFDLGLIKYWHLVKPKKGKDKNKRLKTKLSRKIFYKQNNRLNRMYKGCL